MQQITVGIKPYFRYVGRFIGNVSDKSGIKVQIEIEKKVQAIFDGLECGYVSTYDVSEIEPENRSRWLADLVKHHHYIIYATSPDKAVAFESNLLELEA